MEEDKLYQYIIQSELVSKMLTSLGLRDLELLKTLYEHLRKLDLRSLFITIIVQRSRPFGMSGRKLKVRLRNLKKA